jgi:hypothetical protein
MFTAERQTCYRSVGTTFYACLILAGYAQTHDLLILDISLKTDIERANVYQDTQPARCPLTQLL